MKLWLVIVCLTSTSMGKPFDPPQLPPPSEPPLEILIPPPPGENKDLIKPPEPPMICRPCVNQCALCPRAEKTKDACGCCVCTRKQHETCGRRAGVCGKGLYCKQDFLLLFGTPGICEAEVCKEKICGFQELCELDTKSGGPKCSCERDCSKKPTAKVCSWESDEVFDNFCEVEREECKLGKKIDTYPCTECTKGFGPSKKVYKNGEIIQTKKPCLKEICRNARFEKYLDGECLKENGYTCVDSSENFKDVKCNENQYCRYTFVDKDNEIPSLGQCLEKEKDICYFEERVYKEGETYIDKGCTKSCICNHTMLGEKCKPLCVQAMVSCAPDETAVKYLEATSNTCFCEIKRCIKNAEICRYKKKTGPCYASIPMWYYDSSEKLCKSFVYGGCRGNSNKFYTKEACLDFCQPDVVTVKVSPNGEEKSPLSLVEGDSVVTLGLKDTDEYTRPPQLAELIEKNPEEARFPDATPAPRLMSEKNMTISGKILLGRTVEITENSCLVVTLSDVTLLDISDRPLAQKVYQFNKIFETDYLQFEITSKKPVDKDIYRDYAIRAVLNRGYCGNNKISWIKKNDYVTDTTHSLVLSADKDVYNKDIQTVCYDCKDEIRGPFGEIVGVEKKVVKKSNKSVTVSGTIKFPKKVPTLNSSSCLLISIRDISLADASSELLVVKRLDDLSKINGASEYKYTVETRKPEKFLGRDFSVGAVLNINWCPDLDQNANLLNPEGEWIRDGDFVADTTFKIPFTEEESGYEKDFHLICNNCKDTSVVVPVIPPPANDEEKSCTYEGKEYKHNEEWKPEDCLDCKCINGFAACAGPMCAAPPCENFKKVPGSCCEVSCLDEPMVGNLEVSFIDKNCKDGDKEYKHGENWKRDDCTSCRCDNGLSACATARCYAPCKNPVKVPGQCCPVCPPDAIVIGEVKDKNCTYNEKTYMHGKKFKPDDCSDCTCDNGYSACAVMDCMNVGCRNPVKIPGECCPVCQTNVTKIADIKEKSCTYEGKEYKHNEEWKPEDCLDCKCINGFAACVGPMCAAPPCENFKKVPGSCCEVSCLDEPMVGNLEVSFIGCKEGDAAYKHGEEWISEEDLCEKCTCYNGVTKCSQIKCRRIENCDVPVTIVVGQCCLECPTINAMKVPEVLDKKSCMNDGKEYKNGDKWKPEDCLDCSCLNGKVICGGPACEAPKCENYEKVPGSCCDYTCPAVKVPDVIAADLVVGEVGEKTEGCLFEDRSYSEGDKRKNENEECVCNAEGQWKCQPVGSCFDKNSNKTYQNGEEWVTKDFCGRCVCFQGQQYCASALCDVPECPGGEVYNVEGRCCPVCSTQTICKDENTRHTHTDADVWQNERCHVCTCGDQGITCRQPDVNFDGCKVKVQLTKQCGLVCLQREDEEESREIEEDREEEVKENEAIEGDDEEEEVDGNGDDMEKEENEEGIEKNESDSIENEKKKETVESDGEDKEVEKKVLTCTESHGVYKVGESYKRDCNTCTCVGGVDGEMVWACTLMACLDESETFPKVVKEEKEKAVEQNGKMKNEESEKNVEEKEKVPTCTKSDGVYKVGESYKKDCNTCTCIAGPDGTAGWACTEMGCMSQPFPEP